MIPEDKEWGIWYCPRCGTEHEDPAWWTTCCGNCDLSVRLDGLRDDGEIDVTVLEEDVEIVQC
jgi:hypothetical protein